MSEKNPSSLGDEIVARIDQLAAISETPEHLARIFLTEEHRKAADLILSWMREAGMSAHLDAIGNVCGRYEGIDQRVADDAARRMRVEEVSIGDYVLNGGEVAALAMIEAVGRLVPGVVGNPASLVEESHEDGLLEYPVYTKPADWRGREVPPVLLSGDHGKVAAWRRAQQEERTRERRPDLWAAYGSEA